MLLFPLIQLYLRLLIPLQPGQSQKSQGLVLQTYPLKQLVLEAAFQVQKLLHLYGRAQHLNQDPVKAGFDLRVLILKLSCA